ncbi:MAG: autotransporter domain-containing protein [Roseibium sp.]|uniref:autotransporter domain-containing protein n=1 Tax=Roseibium sp. TaxID=1936156 RepID=UPI001B2B1304|nr:autotransporter domain-containing protein [Roseibium sp.]MBO6894898.1 autotransporter domain-containing protein [Roseibium sp.]MBO6930301.1 autotransporter domain-containing protein [Roseibium sp.]
MFDEDTWQEEQLAQARREGASEEEIAKLRLQLQISALKSKIQDARWEVKGAESSIRLAQAIITEQKADQKTAKSEISILKKWLKDATDKERVWTSELTGSIKFGTEKEYLEDKINYQQFLIEKAQYVIDYQQKQIDFSESKKLNAQAKINTYQSEINSLTSQLSNLISSYWPVRSSADYGRLPARPQTTPEYFSPFSLHTLSENSISFSASLRGLRKQRAAKARSASTRIENAFVDAGRPGYVDPDLPGLLGDRRFNAWIDGSYTWTDDDRTGAEASSEAGIVRAGLHYTFHPRVGVGGIFRYAFNESDRSDRSVTTDGDGFGASVYSQVRLPYGAVLSPVFAYERANTDIAIANGGTTVTGNFDTDIFTLGGTLSRRFRVDTGMKNTGFFIDPNLTLSYIAAKRRRYVRDDGEVIPGEDSEQGTFVFGPTIGLQIRNVSENIALIQPTLGVNGNWNFLRPDSYLSTSNTVVSTPTAFGSVTGGLSVALTNGLNGQINGTYSGFGSDVTSTSIFGRLALPF